MDNLTNGIIAGRIHPAARVDYQIQDLGASSGAGRVAAAILAASVYSAQTPTGTNQVNTPSTAAEQTDPNTVAHLWVA